MTLPEVAESFYFHGWNVFLYDARSVGESDGTPRNLLDPLQMAEDLSGKTYPCHFSWRNILTSC